MIQVATLSRQRSESWPARMRSKYFDLQMHRESVGHYYSSEGIVKQFIEATHMINLILKDSDESAL